MAKKALTIHPQIWDGENFVEQEPVTIMVDEEVLKPDPDFNWCECDEPEFGRFCEDGECSDCFKHHYHCLHCDGIFQIG